MVALVATAAAAAIMGAATAGANGDAVRVLAAFVALGACVVALPENRWVVAAVALVVTWWAAVLVIKYLPDVVNPPPAVSQAVGGAAYFDTPYRGAQIAVVVSVALPAVVALALAGLQVARSRGAVADAARQKPDDAVEPLSRPSHRSTLMWIGAAVIAFTLIPDLRDYVRHAGDPASYTWDESNLLAWPGLVQMGLVPMKDFFYPYGFQWLYTDSDFGPVYLWIAQVITLVLAAWSLWRLSFGNTWRVLACLLALVLVGYWEAETWRYVPAFLVPVTYAAIGPGIHGRLRRDHAVFFTACLFAALVEPDLLGFGVVGAVLVLAGQIVARRPPRGPRHLLVGVAIDAVPVIAAVIVVVLIWTATGQLSANVRFYGGFSAVSATSAPNERVLGALGLMVLHPNTYSVYAAIPALLAATGFLWMRVAHGQGAAVGAILLGASGVTLVMVLKHFVRPVDDLVLITPLIALLWAVILAWRHDSLLRATACGLALAALYTMLDTTGGLSFSQFLKMSVASPAHAARSVSIALDPQARIRAAEARAAPARFPGWPDLVIAGYYLGTVKARPLPPFAVVGDSQETYVLLGQRPPWETELYDAAPISEQHAMLNALRRRRPSYVIWRRDLFWDGVPYKIRDPLVFAWMIRNYVPVQAFPNVEILRRRGAGETVPRRFWDAQLGTGVQLGYIPSLSSAAGSPSCVGGTGCVRYIMMSGTSKVPILRFKVTDGVASYIVELDRRRGVTSYPVRADRLWFWPLLAASPRINSLTQGYTAREVGLRSGDNLY